MDPRARPVNRVYLLQLIADGYTLKQIGRHVGLSHRMVCWHLGQVHDAWEAPNITALVSKAMLAGVIH